MPAIDPAIEAVMKADHLSEETRRVYSSKLGIIAQAAGNRPLLKVLTQYPNKVIQYIKAKYNEVCSSKDNACQPHGSLQASGSQS